MNYQLFDRKSVGTHLYRPLSDLDNCAAYWMHDGQSCIQDGSRALLQLQVYRQYRAGTLLAPLSSTFGIAELLFN